MISFCKNCGKPLKIKEEWGIKFGICNCGFKEVVRTLEFQDKQNQEKKGEGVAQKETLGGFPHTCKKCGCELSEVYDLGAHYSDEANIILFKCIKCGYSERQSDGTGN